MLICLRHRPSALRVVQVPRTILEGAGFGCPRQALSCQRPRLQTKHFATLPSVQSIASKEWPLSGGQFGVATDGSWPGCCPMDEVARELTLSTAAIPCAVV